VYACGSKDVTIHNNIFVSHHSGLILHDNTGTLVITHNTFLGPTIHKVYAPRNQRVVIRNNLFGENLFPKKRKQYKVVLMANRSVDMDHNAYYFDPANDERRLVDIGSDRMDLASVKALPEQNGQKKLRVGIKGSLAVWRTQFSQGMHSIIADPKWKDPARVKRLRTRPRGWPSRFFDYPPFARADLALRADSPCVGKGDRGATIGADYSY